jgi:hypothetical protein
MVNNTVIPKRTEYETWKIEFFWIRTLGQHGSCEKAIEISGRYKTQEKTLSPHVSNTIV